MVMRSSDFLSSSTVFVFVHPSETAVSNVVLTKSDDDAATLTGVSTGAFFVSNASLVNSLAYLELHLPLHFGMECGVEYSWYLDWQIIF